MIKCNPHRISTSLFNPSIGSLTMLLSMLVPWVFMAISSAYFLFTVAKLTLAGDFKTLRSWPALKNAWFGEFWAFMGPLSKSRGEGRVIPMLEGRIRGGRVSNQGSSTPIEGVVLEVGAGSGMWTEALATIVGAAKAESRNGPTKIYGIEPNPVSAASLRRRVEETGLKGIYLVVPVGIEDLQNETAWGGRIDTGSVDCIMTVQCLCSIPDPEKNIRLLYSYLKKGGRWYVYEHVKAERGLVVPLFQRFTDIFWRHMMGSCHLCRQTDRVLQEVGTWTKIDLAHPSDEEYYEAIPHVVGILTK
ncbi:phospholipid methyltransferase [Colletotrichum incanum]|uniref:Phospholipid methyltransferase n=1 Tax=Colletotrichum incanum TaxID=1573173 RepID=A0A167DXG1_COLIC|nr:phospholipid methyltransferase [Colletotrichum incanum]